MKKIMFMMALLFSAVMVNAQEAIQTTKWYDNIYLGATGGVTTPLDFNSVFPVNAVAGLKLGKEITPVVGFEAEGLVSFNDNHFGNFSTGIKAMNVGVASILNLSNLFAGYNGKPRPIEFKTNVGVGWLHTYDKASDNITAKTALDIYWNIGHNRPISIVVSPGIYWNLNNFNNPVSSLQFNRHHAQFALMGSFIWHFKGSNGKRYFTKYDVGAMMDEINRLNEELAKKPTEVEVVRTEIKEVPGGVITVDNSYIVTFAKKSYQLSDYAKEMLDIIPAGINVRIFATASPEGNSDFNKQLSQLRADAVKDYLEGRGVKVLSSEGYGVMGETSNRIAVVTIQ